LFRVKDLNGDEIILLRKAGSTYVPKCTSISAFAIIRQLANCYNDIPIIINRTQTAFIHSNGIASTLSVQVSCALANKEINIEDRILIVMKQGVSTAEMIPPPSIYHFKPFHLDSDDLDFNHESALSALQNLPIARPIQTSVLDTNLKFQVYQHDTKVAESTQFTLVQ
jgi:hypothetical protein